jgi:aminopeptidase YwaD
VSRRTHIRFRGPARLRLAGCVLCCLAIASFARAADTPSGGPYALEGPPAWPRGLAGGPNIDSLVAQVSLDTLRNLVARLEAFGTRNAAKQGSRQAAEWLAARFHAYGIRDVEVRSWDQAFAGNVIATMPGAGATPDIYILGAHYDSVAPGSSFEPGADDNGSGTAALLECARILAGRRLAATVRFIAFSAEEYGLVGSEVYAAQAEEFGEPIAAMINMDMIGHLAPDDVRDLDVIFDSRSAWLYEATAAAAAAHVPELPVVRGKLLIGSSDHASFWGHHFSAVLFFEDSADYSPFLHTPQDVTGPSYNDPELHLQCTRVALALLATLAGPGEVPVALASFAARREGGTVRLDWRLSRDAAADLAGIGVQRAPADRGPWQERTVAPLAPDVTSFAESAAPDADLWYRLRFVSQDGSVWTSGAALAAAGRDRTRLEAVLAPDRVGPIQIRYRVADPVMRLRLGVYDARGRLVRVLANASRVPGTYLDTWDRRNDRGERVSSGVYILGLQAPGASDSRKLVILPEPSP